MPSRSQGVAVDSDKAKKSIAAIIQQAVTPNSQPTEATFAELPHVIYWMRAVLGAAVGYYLGMNQVKGAAFLLHVLNFLCFVPVTYTYLYLGLNTSSDQFGGIWKLLWLGVAPAMALCLLVWVYIVTAAHEQELELLNQMLVNATDVSASTKDGPVDAGVDEF